MEPEPTRTPASKAKPTEPLTPKDPRPEDAYVPQVPRAPPETAIKISWFWLTFVVSLVSLIIVWLYYSGRLYLWLQILYWICGALAIGLLIWSTIGILTHYNVLTRIGASAQRRREASDAAAEEQIVYRENPVVRLFKFLWRLVTLLFLFVWNTFLRLLYIAEVSVIRAIILAYDLIYYLSYAAWAIAFWAIRLALRIVRWALRTSWRIVRIVTYLPVAKFLWRRKMRPVIMGKWNARMEERRQRAAKKLEQKRRLVAAQGMDPDKWQKDREARHYFFLPHPHDARKGLRGRLEDRQKQDYNRRDRWLAYRKGLPLPPKYHSERKKAILEEKKRRKAEKKEKKRAGKREEKRDKKRLVKPERRPARGSNGDAKPVPDEK